MSILTMSLTRSASLPGVLTIFIVGACALPAFAKPAPDPVNRCSNTAAAADTACKRDGSAEYWLAEGMCENLPAPADRTACIRDAKQAHTDFLDDCAAQLEVRQQLCSDLGEAAYAPNVSPGNFTTSINNPLLPWIPGTVFVYENTNGEEVTVTVTDQIEVIAGISCVVVHDVGSVGGETTEDTFDYYAQDLAGNVWYIGEDTVQYEDGRVAGVEGAWRTGVDGAKPGIAMEASPAVGDVYRQEFLLGDAEDQAEVLSLSSSATVPFGGTYNNCVEIAETAAIEPDSHERKFYSSGTGQVLTIDDETGEREELVSKTGP